ncbi:MAG: hypothetical protein K5694_02440 [Bacilli bacterium]|nr:hypothetical protein [Bacilli bacterium]
MFRSHVSHDDYTEDMLPSTRKALFSDILKLNFGRILLMGVLVLLFSLPIHLLAIAEDLYQANLMAGLPDKPSAEEAKMVVTNIMNFNLIRNALNIPFLALLALGLGGIGRILRQLSWSEPLDFWHDFFKGLKQNAGQFVIIGLIAGVLNFIANYISNTAAMATGEIYQYLGIIPAVVFVLLLAPIAGFSMVSITTYSNKFWTNIKIGRVCYFGAFFKTLLALAICLIPFIPQVIPNFWSHLIGRILSTLLVPIIYLGWTLYSMNRLDAVVNTTSHPELVRKGLYNQSNK